MGGESYVADRAYEEQMRHDFKDLFEAQTQHALAKFEERELNSSGSYLPAQGIYSIGWTGWKELPAADFVEKLLAWHNGFIRDHRDDPFFPSNSKEINRGELSYEELKTYYQKGIGTAGLHFLYEGISHYRAHLAGLRDIRDLLAWHLFEETGHNELYLDFMAGYFKMDREKELYPLTDTLYLSQAQPKSRARMDWYKNINANGHFVEIAAGVLLPERIIPKSMHLRSYGLRKHYKVPEEFMAYHNIHCFIDIYHPRFGEYILGKYAITKGLQELAERTFKEKVIMEYKNQEAQYAKFRASKK